MVAFKKILFPTDFSPNAARALAHAIRLANFEGGEVIVQHVVGDYFENHPHWATLFDVREMQKHMDGYVTTHMSQIVPRDAGNVRFRTEISKGNRPKRSRHLLNGNMWTWWLWVPQRAWLPIR